MSQVEAQSWWTEVEHLRERIERRRGDVTPATASRAPARSASTAHRVEHDRRGGEASFAPRRTVRIRGQAIATVTAPRLRPTDEPAPGSTSGASEHSPRAPRHRSAARTTERLSATPDRLALWAFGFALLLLLVAAISAQGI